MTTEQEQFVGTELKRMYRGDLELSHVPIVHLREEHIQEWVTELRLSRSALYDQIALLLARGFFRDELPFGFCDNIVNDIHAVITRADDPRPPLFWSVFLAFDEGEYHHPPGDASDPVTKYTRPMIVRVLADLSQ